ncbi:MAG: hypothetical protein HYX49_01740, partial [Chloroflexi bacterium]|nr:hypothetical protein [Chloroflexota bacterium]
TTVGGKNIGLRPFQAWNPTDQKNPDRGEVLIANVGAGEERLTPDQNKAWLGFIYRLNSEPQLMVDSTDALASEGLYSLAGQPSILSLKKLPGNDPAKIQFLGGTILTDIPKAGVDPDLWQWNYTDPLPKELQNLIWLTYLSGDLSGNK